MNPPGNVPIGLADLALARALREQGKNADARAAAAVEHLEPTLGADHVAARAARELAGESGRPPE